MKQFRYYYILIFIVTISLTAHSKSHWVSFDQEVATALQSKAKHPSLVLKNSFTHQGITYGKISSEGAFQLSKFIKKKLHRHGGFISHPKRPIFKSVSKSWRENLIKYGIHQEIKVQNFMDQLNERRISNDIIHLSSYHTRYHTSREGQQAMSWIYNKWSELTSNRSDCEVNYFKHKETPQKSVILTIKGKSKEIIILGGHADSINTDDEGPHSRAPGADDNAAGISVITELIKVIMDNNYVPQKTIQFIAYAAEEVGIIGSYEIAASYAKTKKTVLGVIQFDGVNFQGETFEMALISDYTSKAQNQFMAMLIDTYVKVSWRFEQCGYGCSDHAAWNYEGFHASFPVETIASEQNPYIHSEHDTFDKSNNNAHHAMMFAKLGIAYLVELDNL